MPMKEGRETMVFWLIVKSILPHCLGKKTMDKVGRQEEGTRNSACKH